MEDYLSAFYQRTLDTESLIKESRRVGSVHMGAIAIECLLKALILDRFRIDNWKINSSGVVHGIENPGHELVKAIQTIPELRRRTPQYILEFINILQAPDINYIDMRYNGTDFDEELFRRWLDAYKRLRAWLLSQRPFLHNLGKGR